MSTIPAHALAESIPRASARSVSQARTRLQSIDVVRGLVIVLMALDHVRAYFSGARFDPLDLTQTDAAWFMTRWITHLCAPTFVFLAGISAYLMSRRCEPAVLQRFLVTRGIWLIVLEFTVIQFAWSFNFKYEVGLIMQVIWAIGASMIVMALLVKWPLWAIGAFALVTIAGHNLLDGIRPESFGALAPLWNLLHVQAQTEYAFVIYPLVPWVGIMAAGYCAGALYEMDERKRQPLLVTAGLACLALFVLLRAANGYGDPNPWSAQPTLTQTTLSFIDVHKYPPSLLYVLVTIGFALLMLCAFETLRGRFADVLQTFGRVPLFVYVLHIALAHFAAGVIAAAMGYGDAVLTNLFFVKPDGWGFGLAGVYAAWVGVILILYPACRWFAKVKRRRNEWWMAYL